MNNTIIFEYTPWLILLCIVIAFGYAFLLYFRDKKFNELSKSKIYFLSFLRFSSSLIISLLLLSPLLRSIEISVQKPVVIFAVDNSESIFLSCENKDDKFNLMRQNLQNSINQVADNYEVETFSFGANISDSLTYDFSKKQTDISNVITEINSKFYNKNIGAVILITDGIYNKGSNPLYNLKNVMYPIYTVGVGDTTEYKDFAVKDVEYNNIAFLNNRFPLLVSILSKKLKNQAAVCKVYQNGNLLASKSFTVGSDNYMQKLTFNIEPTKAGIQQYLITVTKLSDERNTINNSKVVAINVIENRQKILILANSPHPDVAAIFNSLKTNSNFDIDVATADRFTGNIADYSLVIFYQLPSQTNSIKTIVNEVIAAEIPMFFVVGTQTNNTELNELNLGLNIVQQNNSYDDVNAFINPNFVDFEVSDKLSSLFQSSPPLIVPFGNYILSGQMKVILMQKVKNIKTSKPLIIFSNSEISIKSSVGFILGENIWRTRMHCFTQFGDFEVFDEFFNQIIQALVLKIDKNRFRVKVDKIIPENQDVLFKAEVYDKIYQLTNTAEVKLSLTDSLGNVLEYVFKKTQSSYVLNIGVLQQGKYTYFASTEVAGEELTTSGAFVVVNSDVEALNLVADHNLLFKISENTGGQFMYPNNLDSLNTFLQTNPNIISISYEKQELDEFVKFKWIFLLIISLLSLEWFLRKFWGSY